MLLAGIVVGIILGLLLGGRLDNLLQVRLRWAGAIFLAVLVRFGTEAAVRSGFPAAEALRLPLFALGFGLLALTLWANRDQPGLLVAAAGVLSNGLAITANGGWMPVWVPSMELVGFTTADLIPGFHRPLPEELGLTFLLRAGPFGDILPIPFPLVTNVVSIGDVFLSMGLGWFVFGTLLRGTSRGPEVLEARLGWTPAPERAAGLTSGVRPETGLAGGSLGALARSGASSLDRPVFLGDTAAGPGLAAAGAGAGEAGAGALAPLVVRIGQHPFVRLSLDARFSAFWLGQTISLFGDRLHQIALAVLVYGLSGSPLLTGLVFLTATLPNLLLGPIAGTFVDRWNHKHVMVASDLLRAALVLALPVAASINLLLVFPVVFLVTTVSIFFRPAKAAVVPRIVRQSDLMAANSATWTSDTLADLIGYPLAGLFVAFLGPSLTLAFWADAATYVISAVLIVGLSIPPVVRSAAAHVGGGLAAFRVELGEGWQFLRSRPALFQNTLISAVAQTSIGATLALTIVYARETLDGTVIPYPANYAAIETAIGLGNLVGGLAVGAVGARLRKGPLIVAGFIVMGLATAMLGLTGNVIVAIGAAVLLGAANLLYIVPTQTLFAELTPQELMGRVVAFRSSLVYGALTGAMAVSGLLAESIQVGLVIAGFGVLTVVCGLVAAALPAVRDV